MNINESHPETIAYRKRVAARMEDLKRTPRESKSGTD